MFLGLSPNSGMLLGGTDSLATAHLLDLQSQAIVVKLLMAWKELSGAERTWCKLQIPVCVSQVSALTMP